MSVQVAVVSVISNDAKLSLHDAYFKGVNWPLNKALPKGAEFLYGPLGIYHEAVLCGQDAGCASATQL